MEKKYYLNSNIPNFSYEVSYSVFMASLDLVSDRLGVVSAETSMVKEIGKIFVIEDFRFTDSYGHVISFAHSVVEVET